MTDRTHIKCAACRDDVLLSDIYRMWCHRCDMIRLMCRACYMHHMYESHACHRCVPQQKLI